MTFTQLEVFAALAKVGSFSRAAAALGITQSAVSHALKQLETELGVCLIRRAGSASALTDVGTRLLQRANDILQQKEALQQEADHERGIARGTLRIASFGATSSLQLLPPLLEKFARQHPLVEVQIDEQVDEAVIQSLLERRVELGFVVLPDERFEVVPLAQDELVAVLPESHALAGKARIAARDFHGQPFIRTAAGSGAHIDQFLTAQGAVPRTLFRFEQLASMLGFVARGHALAIAARLALPDAPRGVVYRGFEPPRLRMTALAALRFERLSPAAQAFVALAKSQARAVQAGAHHTYNKKHSH